MEGGSMTVTTESGLVGLDDEVRSRMARRGQTTLGELDLQIDMKQGVALGNAGGYNWYRCTASTTTILHSSRDPSFEAFLVIPTLTKETT
ncbi:hypothetical protein E2562_024789 [Oryza meyeriana var. granulata]|uniref:Uncharacterized protein n=1 Tax=Oryza meyeriana var. granulata TaxID=110450 RepID=A0A6G1E157_9ORYZ|nr:hypothetical protein E2562_024789 [Oryza meyeriana var. granulata]